MPYLPCFIQQGVYNWKLGEQICQSEYTEQNLQKHDAAAEKIGLCRVYVIK